MLRWTGGARAEASRRQSVSAQLATATGGRTLRVEVVEPPDVGTSDGRSVVSRSRREKRKKEENLDVLSMFPPKPKKRRHQVLRPLGRDDVAELSDDRLSKTPFAEALNILRGGAQSKKTRPQAYSTPGMKASKPVSPCASSSEGIVTPTGTPPENRQLLGGDTFIDDVISQVLDDVEPGGSSRGTSLEGDTTTTTPTDWLLA